MTFLSNCRQQKKDNKIEDRSIEHFQSGEQREHRLKKNEWSLKNL